MAIVVTLAPPLSDSPRRSSTFVLRFTVQRRRPVAMDVRQDGVSAQAQAGRRISTQIFGLRSHSSRERSADQQDDDEDRGEGRGGKKRLRYEAESVSLSGGSHQARVPPSVLITVADVVSYYFLRGTRVKFSSKADIRASA